jgi:hypothetical protein
MISALKIAGTRGAFSNVVYQRQKVLMPGTRAVKISAFYSFMGCALILIATSRYGIGLSADSVTYLAGARNMLEGHGYLNISGEPILAFPPLFSTLIAILSWGGLSDPAGMARLINVICFGLVVFLAAQWSFRHLRSSTLAALGTTAVLFAPPLLGISVYAWSEPLFLVLTMLMLLQLQRDDFAHCLTPWVLTGMFAALAILDRYAGITVLITGAILLAAKRMDNLISLVGRLSLSLSIAVLPVSLWVYRNYAISSTVTGYRAASTRTWIETGYDMLNVLSIWFLPPSVPFRFRMYLIPLLIVICSCIVFAVPGRKIATADIKAIIPFLLFTGIYSVFMIYTTSTTALSPIDDRYMSPIFVPLILSLFYLLDRLMSQSSPAAGNAIYRAIIAASLAIWLTYPIITVFKMVKAYIAQGAGGFSTAYWVESDLIAYLKSSKLSGTIYTNEPSGVYALTGQAYKQSPEKFAYESQVPTDDLLHFQADVQSQGMIYIVWFHTDWWKGWLYDIDDLKKICSLERIVTRRDGDVYRVRFSHCRQPT